eukprot:8309548-Pyramimonas_sp.AAC.1
MLESLAALAENKRYSQKTMAERGGEPEEEWARWDGKELERQLKTRAADRKAVAGVSGTSGRRVAGREGRRGGGGLW